MVTTVRPEDYNLWKCMKCGFKGEPKVFIEEGCPKCNKKQKNSHTR